MRNKYFRIDREMSRIGESYMRYSPKKIAEVYASNDIEIEVDVARSSCEPYPEPEPMTYTKVRPIIREDYDRAFNNVYPQLQSFSPHDYECYAVINSATFIEIYAFSPEGKSKRQYCKIDVRDFNDCIFCAIRCANGYSERGRARRKGKAINTDIFIRAKALVMEYIYDFDSLNTLLDKFMRTFTKLAFCDDEPLVPLRPVADFSRAIEQIEQRKATLSNQLIELDESRETRIKLRSEIAGLDYAIAVLKNHAQN